MSKIVKRTLDVFELFANQKRPLLLSEISKHLDIPISSCHDVIHSMEERGYVYQLGARGAYYPTQRLPELGPILTENDPILMRAEIALRNLRDNLDESVTLAKYERDVATYLLVLEPQQPLRFTVRTGEKVRSFHATSAGKYILSLKSPAELETWFKSNKLIALTEKTVTDRKLIEAELDMTRSRGWSLNRDESVPGGTTISSGFSWNRSHFVVTVAGSSLRMADRIDAVAEQICAICKTLENPV